MSQQDMPNREHILWHYNLNSRRTKRSFEHFKILMAEAIKLSPCTIKFTSPDIEKLEVKLKNSVPMDVVMGLVEALKGIKKTKITGADVYSGAEAMQYDAFEALEKFEHWQKGCGE